MTTLSFTSTSTSIVQICKLLVVLVLVRGYVGPSWNVAFSGRLMGNCIGIPVSSFAVYARATSPRVKGPAYTPPTKSTRSTQSTTSSSPSSTQGSNDNMRREASGGGGRSPGPGRSQGRGSTPVSSSQTASRSSREDDNWTTTSFSDEDAPRTEAGVPRYKRSSASTSDADVDVDRSGDSDDASDARGYEELGEQPGDFKSGFVSILGNPNVGKSTLMNALLGQSLSIVSPKPQTTRHRILGVLTNTSYQLVFSDTPGMLLPAYKLQEAMMESVRTAAGDADVVCMVTDPYGEALADKKVTQKLEVTSRPVIIIINKSDILAEAQAGAGFRGGLVSNGSDSSVSFSELSSEAAGAPLVDPPQPRRRLLLRRQQPQLQQQSQLSQTQGGSSVTAADANSLAAEYGQLHAAMQRESASAMASENAEGGDGGKSGGDKAAREQPTIMPLPALLARWGQRLPRAKIICVSAKEGWGLTELQELLVSLSPRGPKYFPSDTVTNRDERFFASEIVREALLQSYQDEVPYSCEVSIEGFQDKPGLSVIEALIAVSRESQKAILIGSGGARIKELGVLARAKLEAFLDRRVYLSLRVRVDEDWRANDEALARYGYINDDFG